METQPRITSGQTIIPSHSTTTGAASSWVETTADILVLCLLLVVLGYLGFVSGRGLDITDDGYYLLSARYPDEVVFWPGVTHLYAGALFHLCGYNVIAFRLIGIALTTASGVVLAIGLLRLLDRLGYRAGPGRAGDLGAVSMVCIGALLIYHWFLLTPSYNTLNAAALNCAVGLFLAALAGLVTASPLTRTSVVTAFAAGVFLGIDFFVKFPAAIAVFLGFGIVLVAWPTLTLRQSTFTLGSMALGAAGWLGLHFAIIQPAADWWRFTRDGIEAKYLLNSDQRLSSLARYGEEMLELLKRVTYDYWMLYLALVAIALICRARERQGRPRPLWVAPVLVAIVVLGAMLAYHHGLHVAGMNSSFNLVRFHLSWLLLIALIALVVRMALRASEQELRRQRVCLPAVGLIAITLFAVPFASAVGTGNPIYAVVVLYMAGWFALLAWLLRMISPRGRMPWVAAAAKVIVVGFACSQIVLGSWHAPYRLNGDLAAQTEPTAVGDPATMLDLDPPTSQFLRETRRILYANGFRPGTGMLGLFNMQGVIFAVGGKSLGLPWYSDGYEGSRAVTEFALSRVPRERLRRAYILQTSGSAKDMPDLAKFGLDFPHGYQLCGELKIPYPWTKETVRIWKPASSQ